MRATLHPGTAMVSQACLISSHHRQERLGPLFGNRAETVFSETMPRPQLQLGLPLAPILSLFNPKAHISSPADSLDPFICSSPQYSHTADMAPCLSLYWGQWPGLACYGCRSLGVSLKSLVPQLEKQLLLL